MNATRNRHSRTPRYRGFALPPADGFARIPRPSPLRESPCPDCNRKVAAEAQCCYDRTDPSCIRRKFTTKDLFYAIVGRDERMMHTLTHRVPQSRLRRMLNSPRLNRALELEYEAQAQLSSYAIGASLSSMLQQYSEMSRQGTLEQRRKVLQDLIRMARMEMASRSPAPKAIRRQEQYRLLSRMIGSSRLSARDVGALMRKLGAIAEVPRRRRLAPARLRRAQLTATPARRLEGRGR